MRTKNKSIILLCLALGWLSSACTTASRAKIATVVHQERGSLSYETGEEIVASIQELAQEYQLDPMLILAIIKTESSFNPRALSHRGAMGLMQVKSIVVRDVAVDLGILPKDSQRLKSDLKFNLRVGVHYLSKLLEQYHGDLRKALMAYNAGPTTVSRLYKNRPVPVGGYQGRVLKAYRVYSSI